MCKCVIKVISLFVGGGQHFIYSVGIEMSKNRNLVDFHIVIITVLLP